MSCSIWAFFLSLLCWIGRVFRCITSGCCSRNENDLGDSFHDKNDENELLAPENTSIETSIPLQIGPDSSSLENNQFDNLADENETPNLKEIEFQNQDTSSSLTVKPCNLDSTKLGKSGKRKKKNQNHKKNNKKKSKTLSTIVNEKTTTGVGDEVSEPHTHSKNQTSTRPPSNILENNKKNSKDFSPILSNEKLTTGVGDEVVVSGKNNKNQTSKQHFSSTKPQTKILEKKVVKPPSLSNIGANCYLNSAFQGISSCNKFLSDLDTLRQKYGSRVEKLAVFYQLIDILNGGKSKSLEISRNPIFKNWNKPGQQDSFELLAHVMNQVYNDIRKYLESEGEIPKKNIQEWLKKELPMRIIIQYEIHCHCKSIIYVPLQSDLALHVTIPLTGSSNLQELVNMFFNRDRIEDYDCETEGCDGKSAFRYTRLIAPLPRTLCIHLQKTFWNGYKMEKITKKIKFSRELNIQSKFLISHDTLQNSITKANEDKLKLESSKENKESSESKCNESNLDEILKDKDKTATKVDAKCSENLEKNQLTEKTLNTEKEIKSDVQESESSEKEGVKIIPNEETPDNLEKNQLNKKPSISESEIKSDVQKTESSEKEDLNIISNEETPDNLEKNQLTENTLNSEKEINSDLKKTESLTKEDAIIDDEESTENKHQLTENHSISESEIKSDVQESESLEKEDIKIIAKKEPSENLEKNQSNEKTLNTEKEIKSDVQETEYLEKEDVKIIRSEETPDNLEKNQLTEKTLNTEKEINSDLKKTKSLTKEDAIIDEEKSSENKHQLTENHSISESEIKSDVQESESSEKEDVKIIAKKEPPDNLDKNQLTENHLIPKDGIRSDPHISKAFKDDSVNSVAGKLSDKDEEYKDDAESSDNLCKTQSTEMLSLFKPENLHETESLDAVNNNGTTEINFNHENHANSPQKSVSDIPDESKEITSVMKTENLKEFESNNERNNSNAKESIGDSLVDNNVIAAPHEIPLSLTDLNVANHNFILQSDFDNNVDNSITSNSNIPANINISSCSENVSDFHQENGCFPLQSDIQGPVLNTFSNDTRIERIDSETENYLLTSVIVHYGGVYGGHYVCYRYSNGQWYMTNDSSIYPVHEQDVLNSEAYILFYEKS